MMLWEILRDLNTTDKYPIGTTFESTFPSWKENNIVMVVKPLNNDAEVRQGKVLILPVDINGKKNRLLSICGASMNFEWLKLNDEKGELSNESI